MPLLAEYALTPNVFYGETFGDEELALSCLALLREALFNEGIVRDLRNGEWRRVFAATDRQLHRRGKEMIKKLISQGRVRKYPGALEKQVEHDKDWCEEALATHEQEELEGVITSRDIAAHHSENPIVASILNLAGAPWWARRAPSIRIDRKVDNYLENLRLLFSCSNHLMFIDPNLDPTKANYRDFKALFASAVRGDNSPRIELHRKITDGSGRSAQLISIEVWMQRFRGELLPLLQEGVEVEVFIWDNLHDRYLLSNLTGISLPYGFDTSRRDDDMTTWFRVGRDDRDDLMREHDPACHRHKCQGSFKL